MPWLLSSSAQVGDSELAIRGLRLEINIKITKPEHARMGAFPLAVCRLIEFIQYHLA
jgi:hypothetical protein